MRTPVVVKTFKNCILPYRNRSKPRVSNLRPAGRSPARLSYITNVGHTAKTKMTTKQIQLPLL